ncbi:MAG: prepilin-type N-terminal cleavage/methylation domain-containing protein, partial [Candidatus Sungiibacteriota bacterium]
MKQGNGYTLIELVIYVGIVAVVALVVTNSILIFNRTLTSFRLERRLATSSETAMRRIVREAHLASDIYASSSLGVSLGVLSLASQESEEDAAVKDVMIYVSGGVLTLRRATGPAVALTAIGVTVT